MQHVLGKWNLFTKFGNFIVSGYKDITGETWSFSKLWVFLTDTIYRTKYKFSKIFFSQNLNVMTVSILEILHSNQFSKNTSISRPVQTLPLKFSPELANALR